MKIFVCRVYRVVHIYESVDPNNADTISQVINRFHFLCCVFLDGFSYC